MSAVDSRPPAQVIIGLDVGTTATKAAAFGVDRPWTRNVSYGYPLLEPEPGWQVQRPAAVHDAVIAALRDIVRASEGAEVVAIAGNHDHPGTFDAYRPIYAAGGIHMVGRPRTAADGGVITLTARNTGEEATVAVLPFLPQRYAARTAELDTRRPCTS